VKSGGGNREGRREGRGDFSETGSMAKAFFFVFGGGYNESLSEGDVTRKLEEKGEDGSSKGGKYEENIGDEFQFEGRWT